MRPFIKNVNFPRFPGVFRFRYCAGHHSPNIKSPTESPPRAPSKMVNQSKSSDTSDVLVVYIIYVCVCIPDIFPNIFISVTHACYIIYYDLTNTTPCVIPA